MATGEAGVATGELGSDSSGDVDVSFDPHPTTKLKHKSTIKIFSFILAPYDNQTGLMVTHSTLSVLPTQAITP